MQGQLGAMASVPDSGPGSHGMEGDAERSGLLILGWCEPWVIGKKFWEIAEHGTFEKDMRK